MGDENVDGGSRTWDGLVHDVFNPEDMHVLAIDANEVCLKYLVTLLHKCQYKVTWTTLAAEALKILRENKNMYDIVITDVVRLDMDGFKLLEIIGLQMDIPIIMVSAEDSWSSIMKGIRHGARDYLIKPVRMQEIRNIWQHVVRKRLSDRSCQKSKRSLEENPKENEKIDYGCNGKVATSSGKKPRVAWTPDLHSKFVDAIQFLEAQNENTYPKRILEIMDVKWLNRENVASHLQKFRNVWKKQKVEGEKQCSNGSTETNISFGDNLASSNINNICVSTKVAVDPIPSTAISHAQLLPQNQNYPTLANLQKLINYGPSWNFTSNISQPITNFLPYVCPLPVSFNPTSLVPEIALPTNEDFLVPLVPVQSEAESDSYGYGNNHVSYGRGATRFDNKCHNIPQPTTDHPVIYDESKALVDEEMIRDMVNQLNHEGASSL